MTPNDIFTKEKVKDVINLLNHQHHWHQEPPTEPGWYLVFGKDEEYHFIEFKEDYPFERFNDFFFAWYREKIIPYQL